MSDISTICVKCGLTFRQLIDQGIVYICPNCSGIGYHLKHIEKGQIGELSKIIEEVEELKDSWEQKNKVMALLELSDIIGAISYFLENHYSNKITVEDLITMSLATKRAFQSGKRK